MNIFVLDENCTFAAKYHCDKHLSKMILESAQMLSTACRYCGMDVGYKSTHANHPCNKWVRESRSNFIWLWHLVDCLNDEWKHRFGHIKNHKSFEVAMNLPFPNLPNRPLTSFAQAMPDRFKTNNSVIAYRNYYKFKKYKFQQKNMWKYTKREEPLWLQNSIYLDEELFDI